MYGKLFESTYTGSMFGAGINVHAVWAYIVAHCKPDSLVEINTKIVASVLGGTEQEVQRALSFLLEPDQNSRSKDEGGRRLVREGEYLYRVVNYHKYHSLRNNEERREYNRIKKQESRSRAVSNDVNASVIDMSAVSAHTDTDTYTETKRGKPPPLGVRSLSHQHRRRWNSMSRKRGTPLTRYLFGVTMKPLGGWWAKTK